MFNLRLIQLVPDSMSFVLKTVLIKWCGLILNTTLLFIISILIEKLFFNHLTLAMMGISYFILGILLLLLYQCKIQATRFSYLASCKVKNHLRSLIYNKLLNLGPSYQTQASTSEITQISTEGVEQIEIYFSAYLPQLFYSLLAPLTLFIILSFLNLKISLILLICVPLIPLSIMLINTLAKKIFSKYWSVYTHLGDSFLDNLMGLSTLKAYSADGYYNDKMNEDAEHFRKITMRLLTMQLNSITLMDIIAYGGASLGIVLTLIAFKNGQLTLAKSIVFILITSEFFIPLRQLGSLFHVAMNGMTAAKKIFKIIDLQAPSTNHSYLPFEEGDLCIQNVSFSYVPNHPILEDISLVIKANSLVGIIGESGCGKSSLVQLLAGFKMPDSGSITINGQPLHTLNSASLMQNLTIVSSQSYLFKGSVRDNLLLANSDATDMQLLQALEEVNLYDFIASQGGLDFMLNENASNLSGGQKQRLALARSLIHNPKIYIFDEATSNIDTASEAIIYEVIQNLRKTKTIILISHRLDAMTTCDCLFMLDKGRLIEKGTHAELLSIHGSYYDLFMKQNQLKTIYQGDSAYA